MDSRPDVVFEHAALIDGTGADKRVVDIALAGPHIIKIDTALPEAYKATASTRIKLSSTQVLTPGFIDVHAHGELEPLADSSAAGKVLGGVTSEISGNCGCTPFPLFGDLRKRWEREASDVFQWGAERLNWSSVGEYFQRLDEKGCSINRGFLLGHGSLRVAVNGYSDRALDSEDVGRMRREVESALEAGVFGLSSGLVYPPGCYAPAEEIMDLAGLCARKGALYTTHMRSEGDGLEEAILETLEVTRKTGVRTQISHLKTAGQHNWSKINSLDKTLHAARREGLDFHADRYPYVASSTGLDDLLPDWAYKGGNEEELKRLQDKALCEQMEKEILARNPDPEFWQRVVVAAAVDENLGREVAGHSISAVAEKWNVRPFEAFRKILIEDQLRTSAIFFIMNEENLERILEWDFVMIASDATARHVCGPTCLAHPHPRTFGTFPKVLAKYVRERNCFSLPQAINKMTGLPASVFGLKGRGIIEEGAYADIAIFDPEKIQDQATFSNPNQLPVGMDHVYVNGIPVVRDSALLEARPGQVLLRS